MTATHLDFAIVGRARGTGRTGSAVAAAAYNLCARLDGPAGSYDYSRKVAEHMGGCVMLPAGAPPALADPGALWRAAEQTEKRSDAQLARQVLISLPRECPPDLRLDLARAIVSPWVADGMGAQVDIHCPHASDGGEQPHAHVLLTLRRVTDAGLAPTKTREWNQAFRSGEGRVMRKTITDRATAYLMARGIDPGMDSRSLAERGEQRTPEPSSRREDWQRWQRAGSDPEQAPAPVAAVLSHRRRRSALATTTALADQAAAEAADLVAQLAAVSAVPARPPEPHTWPIPAREISRILPTKPLSAAPPKETAADDRRDIERATPQPKEADMPRSAPRRDTQRPARPTPRSEPWMRQEGGYGALSDALRTAATRSYEQWSASKPRLAERHRLEDYVAYVQDRQAREAERARLATGAPGVPVQPLPSGVSPATGAEGHRAEHLARTLTGVAPVLPSAAWRAEVDTAAGLSRVWPPGLSVHVVDRGNRLEPGGPITAELAAATVQLAADRGWHSLTLTGDQTYRDAIAMAAALHRPPVATDHVLSKQAADQVASQLRDRAQPPALDVAAVQQLAATDPAAAARKVLDHAESKARATLASKPTGSTVPADLAAPRLTDLTARRDQAHEDSREAAVALAAHYASFSWGSRLLDPAVRHRHSLMRAEADRLWRESSKLDNGFPKASRKISIAADREARDNRAAAEDWRWSKPVRTAEASLAQLAAIRQAVEGGSPEAIAAAARGDMRSAAAAAKTWQAAPAAGAAPADPRALAVRQLAAAEQQHAADPQALARARLATAAAVAGDAATISAASSGDPAAVQQTAAAWQRREQERRAREEQERAQLAVAAARMPKEPAQPTM